MSEHIIFELLKVLVDAHTHSKHSNSHGNVRDTLDDINTILTVRIDAGSLTNKNDDDDDIGKADDDYDDDGFEDIIMSCVIMK